MSATRIAIIGAGHVGQALGRCWAQQHNIQVVGICNRSLISSQRASDVIGAGKACDQLSALPDVDVYAIFTPDKAIAHTTQALAHAVPLAGKTVIHASGMHTATILKAAQQAGANTASIHPVKAFHDPIMAAKTFSGTYCGIEGSADALTTVIPLFEDIGAQLFTLNSNHKAAYHGACVIAANFTVTLKDAAMQAFMQAGLSPDHAAEMAGQLMAQALTSMQHQSPEKALTGPAKRGDDATIAAHQQAFAHTDIAALYEALHNATLGLINRHQR